MRYTITTLKDNKITSYTLWASSLAQAEQKAIERDGFKPIEIKESFFLSFPITQKEVIISLKELYLLLQAQTPINRSIQMLQEHCSNPRLSKIFFSIHHSLSNGVSLPESFASYRGVFGDLCIAMLQAGARSGKMVECLGLLLEDLEQREEDRGAVAKALSYPLFVFVATMICFGVLLLFVVPSFVELLTQNGVSLPIYTKILIALFEFVKTYGVLVLLLGIGLGAYVFFEIKKRGRVSQKIYAVILKIPYIGGILKESYLKNYCFCLCILLRSGNAVLQSHCFASSGVFSVVVQKRLEKIKEALENGKSLAYGMQESALFDKLSLSLLEIAQESGRVEEILELCSKNYQKSINAKISKIISLIEPMLTLLLGCFILLLALGIFVPIWDMGF